MAWISLLFAGVLEIAWASGLKRLAHEFSWAVGILTLLAMIASLIALYAAMVRIPLGIAYPIWTGIGSLGAVAVSVAFHNQSMTSTNGLGLLLLILGMILLGFDA
ncbi:SMR family transporter [uncultured Pelagimonas sp.]|uniref:DMT family transporter n=1 Tax=uncultured Pelagimonas sp. TaxID=1618102 RepID=UPI002604EE09|nr:SMR family transporter [uncultured Pelagimonas sp.]